MSDEEKKAIEQQLLDSYFQFRRPLPEDGAFRDHKTTLDIMDDLAPMLKVGEDTVVRYMVDHDYNVTTETDGTLCWAIWRMA